MHASLLFHFTDFPPILPQDAPRLFKHLSTLPDYLQASILSSSTTKTNSLNDLLLQTQALVPSLLSSRPFIDHLPPEILLAIGRFFVFTSRSVPSSGRAFQLAAVSRRWRTIFLADRALWGDLRLSGESERELDRVEAYLQKGPLRTLSFRCERGSADTISRLCRSLGSRGTGLREIGVLAESSFRLDLLWILVGSPPLTQVRAVDFYYWGSPPCIISLPSSHLLSLTSLSLGCIIQHPGSSSLLPLLRLLPNLAFLSLRDCTNLPLILPTMDNTSRLELLSLTSLNLADDQFDNPLQPFDLVAPLLTSLSLRESDAYPNYLYPPLHLPSHHSKLQLLDLKYDRDDIEEETILSLLRQLPSLLSLSFTVLFETISDTTIKALTIPEVGEEGVFEGLCPILTELNLWVLRISNRAIRRLVLSRKEPGRVPLLKLEVTYETMNRKSYEWFEAHVEKFENDHFGDGSEEESDVDV